ncbi:MAG: M3 family metallopeptidase [Hyphomicrobium sp.]
MPAFKKAFGEHRKEISAIGKKSSPPNFTNTLVALEKSGELLNRVCEVFFNLSAADTNPKLQEIERTLAPQLASHWNEIFLNQKLFKRIEQLFQKKDKLKLDEEQHRLLERTHTAFVRAGARLSSKARTRVGEINTKLAELITTFNQNVLADEQAWHLPLEGESDFAGLAPSYLAAAERMASDLKSSARHVVTLSRSSVEPFLQFSARRDLREQAFKAWIKRGEMGGKTDNRKIVAEIVALRKELARLLGYASFAEYSLDDTMAKSPEAVRNLLDRVWSAAVQRVEEEREALAQLAKSEGDNYQIEPWDWRFLAEKERKVRYNLDEKEIRPYLQLEAMIDAAFDTASKLFDIKFKELPKAPRYHPDVRVWEVTTKKGEHVGIFMGDYFARPSKRSGAWMSSFRSQHNLGRGQRPIIVNVMNFVRGAEGQPSLLSLEDARTLFHEFGHGLHGLLSDVTYPSLSGTNVSRDFVELPSQLYEHWLTSRDVLQRFAKHHETGEVMPDALYERLMKARKFNQGFSTVEYVASAYVDMELHSQDLPEEVDISTFESQTLERLGMPREVVMRHRLPHFQHIIGGYAAGYYSYLWSEVMDADAFAAFEETGNVFDKKIAKRLKEHIYAAGNQRDPEEAYRAFRGRGPDVDSLLKKRGLSVS